MHIMCILVPLYLAATSRLHGSSSPLPKTVEAALFSLPYVILAYLYGGHWAAIPALVLTALAKNTGHADGFRNHTRNNAISPIAVMLAKPFSIERNSVAYDRIFWAVKGFLIALPCALVMCIYHAYIPAIWLLMAGFMGMPLGYELAYALRQRSKWLQAKYDSYVPIAEWLTGFIMGVGFLFLL